MEIPCDLRGVAIDDVVLPPAGEMFRRANNPRKRGRSITDTYDPISNRRAFYDTSFALPSPMLESYSSLPGLMLRNDTGCTLRMQVLKTKAGLEQTSCKPGLIFV
jgi:hypothetical protein